MKKKNIYTLILAENNSSHIKTISFEKKYFQIVLGLCIALFLLLTAFLTDYFSLYTDQWSLSQLEKENKQLKQRFVHVDNQLKNLEKTVHQMSSFSKKLEMITRGEPEQLNNQKAFGKIHSNSLITALSSPSSQKRNISSVEKKIDPANLYPSDSMSKSQLEVRIKKLTEKSQLVKEDAWTLYTDLLEKQEVLNNTPSIPPTKGWLSSNFGYRNESIYSDHEPHFHRGVDIASSEGSPVVAAADGKVVYTGYDDYGYGNLVVLDHGYGLKTYYAHLAEIRTKIGKNIHRGEALGNVGSTGRSTGPHLHYEVRIFGTPVNPENYILDQADLHSIY